MKKVLFLILLCLPLVMKAEKFGYVNTQELFALMPEVAKIRAQMDTLQSQYENQLASMQEELQKKMQEYKDKVNTMGDAVKQAKEQELQDMQQRIQLFYQTAEQDIQKKQAEYLAPVHEKMSKAIQTVGEKLGFTYIFDSASLAYISNSSINVFDDVKKELGIK